MREVHVLDHSVPMMSGYAMRSHYILRSLKELGVPVAAVTSPKHRYSVSEDTVDGIPYLHCLAQACRFTARIPFVKEGAEIATMSRTILSRRDAPVSLLAAHSPVVNGLAAIHCARRLGVPFLYEIRAFFEDAAVDQGKMREGGPFYRLSRAVETHIVRRADHVTVICEGLRQELIGRGIDSAKITTIPNGVDADLFTPMARDEQLLERYGLRNVLVVGFIGSFFRFEGLDLLVSAAERVLAKRKDVKFLIVGAGQEEAAVRRMVDSRGLGEHVILTGRVPHEDVRRYYSVMDVCVYPRISRRITELVTPLKPLEAMAMERIVLASDVGGLRELVDDGQTGILFPAGDADALASAVIRVAERAPELDTMGHTARQFVIRERTWQAICRRYLELYASLGMHVRTAGETDAAPSSGAYQ